MKLNRLLSLVVASIYIVLVSKQLLKPIVFLLPMAGIIVIWFPSVARFIYTWMPGISRDEMIVKPSNSDSSNTSNTPDTPQPPTCLFLIIGWGLLVCPLWAFAAMHFG